MELIRRCLRMWWIATRHGAFRLVSLPSSLPWMQPRVDPAHLPYRGFSCGTLFHKVCPTDFRWKTPGAALPARSALGVYA